ncbi:MAG: acylphosphatase [Wenzhouxiangellaceae bacterium]
MTTCSRFFVSGKVQGVFFRASTQRKARALDITGHAVNLEDGRVEVLACGDEQALSDLQAWLHQGPAGAKVEHVAREPAQVEPPGDFSTG